MMFRRLPSTPRPLLASIFLASTALTAPFSSAYAQEAEAAESEVEALIVTGRRVSQTDIAIGLDRVTSTVAVTREELLSAPAGISGLKVLETLPGFNVQTDGALGLYEFGNSVQVRAFNFEQIGFVLDGIPMGRPDAFGGSPIFRYVDNENLASVIASPGAGDVSLPSATSLGPMVSYQTIDPADEPGLFFAYTVGDDNIERTFLRLETGQVGAFSGYVSRSKLDQDVWRGAGTIDREHIEAKGLLEFGPETYLKATFAYNDFFDFDTPSFSRTTYESTTPDLNGETGRFRGYVDFIPEGCNVGTEEPVDFNNDGVVDDTDFQPISTGGICTQFVGDRVNVREDALSSLNFRTRLFENMTLDALVYYEDKDGFGVSPDGYGNTRGRYLDQVEVGLPVTHPRGIQYGLSTVSGDRGGATFGVTYEAGNHLIEAGYWYEQEQYRRQQLRYNKTNGSPAGAVLWDEVSYFRRDYVSEREFQQFYLKDTISLLEDKLTVEAGFKALDLSYELDGFRDFADYAIRVGDPGGGDTLEGFGGAAVGSDWSDSFLPSIGAVYNITPSEQIFASYSENFAIPRETDSLFDDAVSFDAPAPDAEEAQNYEIGVRTNRSGLALSAAAYYTVFDNRIVSGSVINPATQQPESFGVNVGEVTAMGVEITGQYQPPIFNDVFYTQFNFTYNETEQEETGDALADSPEILFTGGVTYEPSSWFVANLSGKYTGERFADFKEADGAPNNVMEEYWLWSLYADVGGENPFGLPDNVRLRLNVDNIFDEDTLAFTFTTTGNNAFYRPLSPRTVYFTISAEF